MTLLTRPAFVLPFLLAACSSGGSPPLPDSPEVATDPGSAEPIVEVVAEVPDVPGEDVPAPRDIAEEEPFDAAGTDAGEDSIADVVALCPGGPDCPCAKDSDCTAGPCMETTEGRKCGRACSAGEACPDGRVCLPYGVTGEEARFCTDPLVTLCRPCIEDGDCAVASGDAAHHCLDAGPSGRFCGTACDDVAPCPEGYDCAGPSGVPDGAKYCRPSGGAACSCTDAFKAGGFKTVCYRENEIGKCPGERTCDTECNARVPLAETCNLADDDCDGEIDEGIPSVPCDLKNDFGTCQGTSACAGGQVVCQGTPAVAEACNGLDEDCDGLVDEESADGCTAFALDEDRDGFQNS